MREKKLQKNKGYTLLETTVATSIFLIVLMIGMGALLNANAVHKKSQNMRSLMDSLSFVMEDMSRNLRTGYDYHCIDDGNLSAVNPHSCANGAGVSFKSAEGDRMIYYINAGGIQKYTNGVGVPLVTSEISISPLSGFTVTGAEFADASQSFVIMRLVGTITYKNLTTPFSLQTSVSQRLIDIL